MNDSSLLRPYQVGDAEGMLQSLDAIGAVLNAGDMGTGKTYSICGVARELGTAPVVVCPRGVIPIWHEVAAFLGGTVHTINYERLTRSKNEFGVMTLPNGLKEVRKKIRELTREIDLFQDVEGILIGSVIPEYEGQVEELKKLYPHGWYHQKTSALISAKLELKALHRMRSFRWDPEIPLIVFDEGHRCKNKKSLNAQALLAAKRQRIPVIIASATAAKDPLDMYALGFALELHSGVNFWSWAKSYGCEIQDHGGLVFHGGAPALKRLHASIFPKRGVRVTREEIPDFPETQITAELYELPNPEEIDALYADLEFQLGSLAKLRATDRDQEHVLTQLLRDRQQIELLKVPLFVELAEDAREEGMSVAIFVNFDVTLREIATRLKTTVTVDGGQVGDAGARTRQFNIDLFNSGETDLIILNIKAGGVGLSLHDLDGRFPRLALISPTYSALDLTQVFGRVWRLNGKSKSLQRIVLIKGTVEERIQKALYHNLNNISLINDGDLRTVIT